MSAKLLYNLSDENPNNLHKQNGCMNGIFQVFYRQHYPARRVLGHYHKTLSPPGETSLANDNEKDKTMEKKATKEKQRVSTESSSRPSFSSSPRSSSFSSADVSMASQFESPPMTQTDNSANSIREAPNRSPWRGSLTQCDLRELVKGFIHRDTKAKDEVAMACVSLLKDLPSQSSSEWNEGRRVAHLKGSPRLSYDERDSRNNGYKTATKPRELPRLSLDSRTNSFRSSRADARSNSPLEDGNGQEPATHRRTTSSVVAKLMGLEVLPYTTTSEHDCLSGPPVKADNNSQNLFCDSSRPFHGEAARQRSRGADSIKKMTPASKFPIEPAPRKQEDDIKGQNPSHKTQAKAADSALTVYAEIQKRLMQLEFKTSGKDLRALRQILEAMENTQQLINSRKDDTLNSTTLARNRSTPVQRTQKPTPAVTVATTPSRNFRSSIVVMKPAQVLQESKNVALSNLQNGNSRQIRKGMQGKQMAMDLTPRPGLYKGQLDSTVKNTSGGTLRLMRTSAESCSSKSDMAKSGRSEHSVGPRLQQKKLGFEWQPQPTTPTPEASKTQRPLSRQQTPRRKQGTKTCNLPQSDDRMSDASSDLRSLSHQSEAKSLRSDSNISSVANACIEVTNRYRFERPCDNPEQQTPKQRSPELGFKQERPMLKPVKVTLEQPSPVSVLDAAFYEDESPSPVRKISTVFKEDDVLSAEEAEWIKEDTSQTPTGFRRPIVLPDFVEGFMDEVAFTCDIKNADHKYISEILLSSGLLRDLEYSMISIQLHQSRLPINPSLFFVLEQNQASDFILQDRQRGKRIGQVNRTEKIRRKLLFDTINEILAQRFVAEGCIKPHIKSSPLTEKRSRGKYLLRSLCSEIDRLQANNSKCSLDDDEEDIIWEDLQNQGMSWRDFEGETPAIVLDIERMMFKDMINEVVTSEITAVRGRFSRQPRQLFS
ncbi:PREDICTED: protein LONGIFOLIA 2-like [Tarenaya hassleriana]|uniref:protein LONGIFOLIA 2-like n=1 Tax=Tarenaya hassleriana TaxID=28532 RepID=UPI00053C6F10|nr:PREDICTED: protein LONGIFOLIA 2-like [Tarenaya hassleriana]